MVKLNFHIAIAALFLVSVMNAFAVPAKPGLLKMQQPDGSVIEVRLIGDEHAHFYLSEDGYALFNDGNDNFFYGKLDSRGAAVNSGVRAVAPALRTAEDALFLSTIDKDAVVEAMGRSCSQIMKSSPMRNPGLFETGFPSTGDQKGIVVLVEYQDVKFQIDDPLEYFGNMLNQNGFSEYGGTGCAAEYFRESSKNKFRPEFDVFGPITLSKSMSYYGGNDWRGNDQHPEEMVIEACQQLDGEVDFSEYDRDDDGYIDNVFVFYAGRGEASGGSANTVWPHSWNVSSATSTQYIFDGVRLDRYACSNEWEGSRPDGVGTFVHEFSHVMGLPDLYATSYTGAFTPGSWSAMDYGPYNNGGCTPPLYSIYERYSLEWIEPTVITGPESITLKPISNNVGCIIPTSDPNEFFLLENRQKTGWDAYIPGHGMLVWHVDFDQYVWNSNVVNNTPSHQYVDLEEADGTQTEYSRDGDSFPGASKVTSFTDDTSPSMKTWSGQRLELPITDITEAGGIIRFNVAGGRPQIDPVEALEATDVTGSAFTAHWALSEQAVTYNISVYTKKETTPGKVILTYAEGYYNHDAGNAAEIRVEGLEALTDYYYVVYAMDELGHGNPSNEIAVTTGEPTFDMLAPVALPASDVTCKSFTANWELLPGAVGYTLDLYEKELGDFSLDLVDFADGVKELPGGWKSSSRQSYANDAYSGNAKPAIRFAGEDYIESPRYDGDVRSLSFWHRGSKASADNRIVVSWATSTGKWTTLGEYPVTNEAGGKVIDIADIPSGARKVRISYSMPGSGSLAIDDINVEWGGTETILGGLSYQIEFSTDRLPLEHLAPSTAYYYRVTATDGTLKSRPSNEVKIVTPDDPQLGIADAEASAIAVSVAGDVLKISGAMGEAVAVYDSLGRLIAAYPAAPATVEVILPAKGVYIVKAGAHPVRKIVR